jgi:outer membrane protein TolC
MQFAGPHVQLAMRRMEISPHVARKLTPLQIHVHQAIRTSLLLALAVFAAAANQSSLPKELSLAEALDMALRNSTTIRMAQANLEQASGQYAQSRSALLPQVDVFARQSFQTVNLIGIGIDLPFARGLIGPFGSMDVRASLRQDLLNLASLRAQQSFRWRRESSRFLTYDAREVVTLNVVATYLQALRAKVSRDTLAEQTKLAEDLYRVARDRARQGAAAELDAIRAMQQVNTLEQQRQEAEQNYVAAKLSLANILHVPITADFEVADSAAYGSAMPLDRQAAINAALASRPDYRAAAAEVTAAELRVRSAKASRLPVLGMSFGDGHSGNTPVHNVNTYKIQGSIAVPIFTGGRIRGEIEEAEGALRGARSALDENRSQIETDVLTA